MESNKPEIQATAAKLGIGCYQRHVFLCTGPTCCTPEDGQQAWDKLKQTLKNANLIGTPEGCYRTKVGCLRICQDGPTMVVYPEGTWYQGMTQDRILHFVEEHLVKGNPVEDWIFARNPISEDKDQNL